MIRYPMIGLLAGSLLIAFPTTNYAQDAEAAQAREQAGQTALREAERELQKAAQRVAELSRGLAPEVVLRAERMVKNARGPRLGMSLTTEVINGERSDGIRIQSVSPGSAAAAAGIKSGDRLMGFESSALDDLPADAVVAIISEGLADKQVGDSVQVVTERDGKQINHTVTLNEQSFAPVMMAFDRRAAGPGDRRVVEIERLRGLHDKQSEIIERLAPGAPRGPGFRFLSSDSGWAAMELVELSPGLGKYFGADEGLLVVRAPADETLGFEDGDVIRSIDGRTPESVGHAMRILRSYAGGESLRVDILRDRRKKRLDIQMPERVGSHEEALHWQWLFPSGNDGERVMPAVQ